MLITALSVFTVSATERKSSLLVPDPVPITVVLTGAEEAMPGTVIHFYSTWPASRENILVEYNEDKDIYSATFEYLIGDGNVFFWATPGKEGYSGERIFLPELDIKPCPMEVELNIFKSKSRTHPAFLRLLDLFPNAFPILRLLLKL